MVRVTCSIVMRYFRILVACHIESLSHKNGSPIRVFHVWYRLIIQLFCNDIHFSAYLAFVTYWTFFGAVSYSLCTKLSNFRCKTSLYAVFYRRIFCSVTINHRNILVHPLVTYLFCLSHIHVEEFKRCISSINWRFKHQPREYLILSCFSTWSVVGIKIIFCSKLNSRGKCAQLFLIWWFYCVNSKIWRVPEVI